VAVATAARSREDRKVLYLDRLLPYAPLHRALTRAVECAVLSDVDFPPPVLDLGCGDGTFAQALFERPPTAGIDPERSMLRWAARHRAHGSLAQASGAALPFRNGAFGSVLCNSTLEHIRDHETVLREAARVTAAGGTFVLTVPSQYFLPFLLGSTAARTLHAEPLARLYERWTSFMAKVYHAYPPEGWQRLLTEAGFSIRDWRYYFTAGSTRVMDAAQYISGPSYLTKWLLGRWVVWPGKGRLFPLARWLSGLVHEGSGENGAFLFFHCEKA